MAESSHPFGMASRPSPAALGELRLLIDDLSTAFMREEYLALAGLKAPDFASVFARNDPRDSDLLIAQLLQTCRRNGAPPDNQLRLLLDNILIVRDVSASAQAYQDVVRWCATSSIDVGNGRRIGFNELTPAIMNTTDVRERRRLDDARAAAVADQLQPLLIDQFEAQKADARRLGVGGYIELWERRKGMSLRALVDVANRFLVETADLWDRAFRRIVGRSRFPGGPTRADALATFRWPAFDEFFPAERATDAIFGMVRSIGLDPTAGGRIIVDAESRAGKYSRAFCAPVRVPDEVYLVTSPDIGGAQGWGDLLHEMGHALHYAHTSSALPVENRRSGDMAVTEGYAMLFGHLLQCPAWLAVHTTINDRAAEFTRAQAVHELYQLRRYCARLTFEVELYDDSADYARLPARYADLLTAATGFRHRPEDAFLDVDPHFYGTNYIRARMLRPMLVRGLEDRFGSPWWRNAESGACLADQLFSQGNRMSADDLAMRLGGQPLSISALQNSLVHALA